MSAIGKDKTTESAGVMFLFCSNQLNTLGKKQYKTMYIHTLGVFLTLSDDNYLTSS